METNNSNVTISKSEYDRLRFIEVDYERKKDEIDSGLRKYKEELYDMVNEKLDNCDDIVDVNIESQGTYNSRHKYICTSRDKIIKSIIETLGIQDFSSTSIFGTVCSYQIGGKEYTYNEDCSELLEKKERLSQEVEALENKKSNIELEIKIYDKKLKNIVKDKVKNDIKEGKVENRSVLQKIKDLVKTFD